MPHLPLSPEPTTPFHSGIRAVASYHTPQPSVDPHETLCERHVRSSSSLSAYRNDSDGALSKGDASSRQYAYNYSWVRCATEFRPSRTDCMQVLSDFTPSDAVNGPVSARDCCTRATNFFSQSQYRPICTTCGYRLACSLSKALWCAVRLAVHTFAWPIFPERGRLGSIAPWLLTDCSERRLHIITFGWFAGSERCSSCSQYWSVTYE